MANEKNLQELLAAIGGSNSNANVPSSTNPATNPTGSTPLQTPPNFSVSPGLPMQQATPLSLAPTLGAPPNNNPSNHFNTHLNDLVNLLGNPGRNQVPVSTPSVPPGVNPHQLANFATSTGVSLPQSIVSRAPTALPITHVNKQLPGNSQRRGTQPLDIPSHTSALHISQGSAPNQPRNTIDLTTNLTQAISKNQALGILSNRAVSQQGRQRQAPLTASQRSPVSLPRHAASQAARVPPVSGGVRLPANSQQPQAVATNNQRRQSGNRSITQEQIIVGHFCRHSIKLLSRVMHGNPEATMKEGQLKDHIKRVWAQWVKGQISRPQLLDSVATFVRGTCPEAEGVDVVHEFKVWYEREFEIQRQRNTAPNPGNIDQSRRLPGASMPQPTNPLPVTNPSSSGPMAAAPPDIKPTGRNQASAVNAPPVSSAGFNTGPVTTAVAKPLSNVATPAKGETEIGAFSTKGKPDVMITGISTTAGKSLASSGPSHRGGAGRGVGRGGVGSGRGGGRGLGRKTTSAKGGRRIPTIVKSDDAALVPAIPGIVEVSAGLTAANRGLSAAGIALPRAAPEPGAAASSDVSVSLGVPLGTNGAPLPFATHATESVVPAVASLGAPAPQLGLKKGDQTSSPTAAAVSRPGETGQPLSKALIPPKPKAPRKSPPQATAKPVGKVSPIPTKSKPPVSPSTDPMGGLSTNGITIVREKRPHDGTGTVTPPGPSNKKAKMMPKIPKPSSKKLNTSLPTASPAVAKQPVRNTPVSKMRTSGSKPPTLQTPMPSPLRPASNGQNGVASGAPPSGAGPKRANRVDEELTVVNGVVNIEEEEDRLVMREGNDDVVLVEENVYSESMLLSGGRLRAKMQHVARRFMLDENINGDVMELMSLAVEERLRYVIEGLLDAAACRTDAQKNDWNVENDGVCVYDKMVQLRDDEERSLVVAADMRMKRRNERKEADVKKAITEATTSEKKDSNAAADAERKEKLAFEKKRRENSSQRDALSGLLEGRNRKRSSAAKSLAPLKPLVGGKGLAALPPLTKKSESSGLGSASKKTLGALEKLGPLKPLGRNANAAAKKEVKIQKEPLKLSDCIFVFENDVATRKSNLLYRWLARIGVH